VAQSSVIKCALTPILAKSLAIAEPISFGTGK
jgi:hypothetical protein